MGLFFYTQKGSIISMVDLPTTEIIEPINLAERQGYQALFFYIERSSLASILN